MSGQSLGWLILELPFSTLIAIPVPTPQGGSHETGFKGALTRGLKAYGALTKIKRANQITSEDILTSTCGILSVFIPEPQFQGQTKERLNSPEAAKMVENSVKDHFEHWLTQDPVLADSLLARVLGKGRGSFTTSARPGSQT